MNLEIYIVKLATLARIIKLDNVIQGNSTCRLQAFINIGYFEKKNTSKNIQTLTIANRISDRSKNLVLESDPKGPGNSRLGTADLKVQVCRCHLTNQ